MSEQDYFAHDTAIFDNGCPITETKIRHVNHIMTGCIIGNNHSIEQNVVVSSDVILVNNMKVKNNASIHSGVTRDEHVFF